MPYISIIYHLLSLLCCTINLNTFAHNPCELFAKASEYLVWEKYDEAITLYKQFVAEAPYCVDGWYNYALSLHDSGNFERAYPLFKKAYELDPTDHRIRQKLRNHAVRIQQWDEALGTYALKPYWPHKSDLRNKTVMIIADTEGLGDTIFFLRYVKRLHEAGARVVMQTSHELSGLLARCPFIDWCIPRQNAVNADYTIRIMVSRVIVTMRDTMHEPSHDIPYLSADPGLVDMWKQALKNDTTFRIGMCWRASLLYNSTTRLTTGGPRSIPIEQFVRLCAVPQCTFYNLTKGAGEQDLEKDHFPIIMFNNFDTTHGPFMDTAALMKNLDLVITTDTSIAHLAGALGVPVWVILPACSDFRWFLDRSDSPWYPTMRLFRQKKCGDWHTVLQEVSSALEKEVQTRHIT
jgi:hypothetical protein